MGKVVVKNGTPVDGESLCRTCEHVHMQKGYRDSDEAIFCTYLCWDTPRPVTFKVRDCTDFQDRTTPSRRWMEENALIVEVKKSVHEAGFRMGFGQSDSTPEQPELFNVESGTETSN